MRSIKVNARRSLLSFLGITIGFTSLFLQPTPVDGLCTITMSAIANETIGLFGSPTSSLTVAPGQFGTSILEDDDSPADPAAPFAASVNFGNLSHGDGTNTVAKFGLRARGDTACHISCSVSSFTATTIRFDQNEVSALSDMTMIKLGTDPMIAGPNGNGSNHSYDAFWSAGTNALSVMNGGVIGAVDSTKQKVCSFSDAPSASGNLTSSDNWVESRVTFSMPTGFRWSAAPGSSNGNFNATLQFEIYTGA